MQKRVLVTGGNGFVGTELCNQLQECAWVSEVIAPTSTEYNLCDEQQVKKMYADISPEIVFHLAATVGGIGANREHPGRFFYDNMAMGLHVMHHAHLNGVKKFMSLGTVCAYPKHTSIPFKEDDLWNGYPEETNAPYGIAKRAQLIQAQAYREEYGFNAIYLLLVNSYGPGDNFDLDTSHVIPALIRKFVEAKESNAPFVTVWGDGSASREFIHVSDAARGMILAVEKYDEPAPINIGSGTEVTIRQLTEIIAAAVGYEGDILWDTSKPNGQPRRCLDVSQAKQLFGFEAAISLEEGIASTVEWYKQHKTSVREVHF